MGLDVGKTVPAVTPTHNALTGIFCFEVAQTCTTQCELDKHPLQKNTHYHPRFLTVLTSSDNLMVRRKMTPERENRSTEEFQVECIKTITHTE